MILKDKVVIVTGAAMGIGLGCASAMARDGAWVALTDIDAAIGREQAARLSESYPVHFFSLDVTHWEQIQSVFEEVHRKAGKIDCLVNNAGYHNGKGILECSLEDWDYLMDVNLKSVFLCSKAVLPYLEETKGSIVNISSCAGTDGQAEAVAYCASKAGILGITRSLALELAPRGIRVNAICPSNVNTPMMDDWISHQPDPTAARKRMETTQPLGRMADAEEIGNLASFLASSRAAFLTGETLVADGGATLGY